MRNAPRRGRYAGVPVCGPSAFRAGVDLYHHFRLTRRTATHRRPATCKEIECKHWLMGWVTVVPSDGPQADYIRRGCGRYFTEQREGPLSRFTFPPGQRCFDSHTVLLERDPLCIYDSQGQQRLLEPLEWIDKFNETSYRATRR